MVKSNAERILIIAEAFGELCDRVVFVGGSVSGLYRDDFAAENPRATDDVDCIVDLSSYEEYRNFCENELLSRNFKNDMTRGAPVCRYVYGEDNLVDVMPDTDTEIGASNRWYKPGFAKRSAYEISSGRIIFLMPVAYYVASKLEALFSRGGGDYRGAKDFEDIVYVIDSCPDLIPSMESMGDKELDDYLKVNFERLLLRKNIDEEIDCSLFDAEEGRREYVKEIMKTIAQGKWKIQH